MNFSALFDSLPRGWLDRDEAELLYESARLTSGPILEVGCFHGRSACLLASLGRPLYCVDPFVGITEDDPTGDVAYRAFVANLAAWGRPPKVIGERGSAASRLYLFRQPVEAWYPRPAGFAYLDGDHTYEGTRVQVLKALRCNPAVVAAHDFVNDYWPGVRAACLDLLGHPHAQASRMAVWHLTANTRR